MLVAFLITLIVVAALGSALRTGKGQRTILRRPYNNRYNDAAGAREDHLG
jgi:hypothetical protein